MLKFAYALILEGRLGYTRDRINEIGEGIATPGATSGDMIERLERLEIDGRKLFKVERKTVRGQLHYDFECRLSEEELAPVGSIGLSQALLLRLYALLGTPIAEDEREEMERLGEQEPGENRQAIDDLARALAIAPPEPTIH